MELSQIIMRGLYLVVLYVVVVMILGSTTPLSGNQLMVLSFFGAVLIFYATFEMVYKFLLNNELIFQIKLSDTSESENGSSGSSGGSSSGSGSGGNSSTEINNELTMSNKKNITNNNISNHSHQYILNRVFDQQAK